MYSDGGAWPLPGLGSFRAAACLNRGQGRLPFMSSVNIKDSSALFGMGRASIHRDSIVTLIRVLVQDPCPEIMVVTSYRP